MDISQTLITVLATATFTAAAGELVRKFLRKHDMDRFLSIEEFDKKCTTLREACPNISAVNNLHDAITELRMDIRELRVAILQATGAKQ